MPPKGSQIDLVLSRLIQKTVPQHFPELKSPVDFSPHLTLTSDIPKEVVENEPQTWLDSLPLNLAKSPIVKFQSLDVGEIFFKKLTLSALIEPLHDVATQIRAAANEGGDARAAERWARDVYAPHVSLLYADLDVQEETRLAILKSLDEAGIELEAEGRLHDKKRAGFDGWTSGSIILVPTWKDLKEWSPIAERAL